MQHATRISRQMSVVIACVMIIAAASLAQAAPLKIRGAAGVAPTVISPLLFQKPELLKHYGKSYVTEWTVFRGSSARMQALAAKEIEFAVLSVPGLALAINNANLDIKVVVDMMQYRRGNYPGVFAVLKNSPIRGAKDLRGKTIAVNVFGANLDMSLRLHMRKFGLQYPADFNIVETRFPMMEAMLRGGKVHAAYFVSSFWDRAVAKGGVRSLFSFIDAVGESQGLVGVMSAEFLKQHRAAVLDFFEDYLFALRWFLDPANRDEALKITSKYSKRPLKRFARWAFTKKDMYRDRNGRPDLKLMQANVDVALREGFIKKGLKIAEHTDLSFIEEANRRLQNR